MNRVLLTGRLTRDPELRTTAGGKAVAQFSIASHEFVGGQEKPEFHNIVTWDRLADTCEGLQELFARFAYADSVIFGHAKDGNIHFMLTDRFEGATALRRFEGFTDAMVDLVLGAGGNLKAEHGTGRAMAPYVRRQYGDELYDVMVRLKRVLDPGGIGKGLGADLVVDAAIADGASAAVVSLGGDVRLAAPAGSPHVVEIAAPEGGELLDRLVVADSAVATSGLRRGDRRHAPDRRAVSRELHPAARRSRAMVRPSPALQVGVHTEQR